MNSKEISNGSFKISKNEVEKKLNDSLGKTLGEADINNVFKKAEGKPKITGIAGDVIEQSVIGYPQNSNQAPDLDIDGVLTELKTTGLRYNEKNSKYIAKEPMSITAVSAERIINEDYENSKFFHKIDNMLFVYYEYLSKKTVTAIEYKNFPILNYHFSDFSLADYEVLKEDWHKVQRFIKEIGNDKKSLEIELPKLSQYCRENLLYMDTAPKFPNSPRFRFKKSFVDSFVDRHINKKTSKYSDINDVSNIESLKSLLKNITNKYKNKTIFEISNSIGFEIDDEKISKQITEQIIVNLLGSKAKKLSNIDIFNKMGLHFKTITLTANDKRTEDMKFFTIDFDKFTENSVFEDSDFFLYFSQCMILCAVFKELETNNKNKTVFVGFKLLTLDDEFLYSEVYKTWYKIKELIVNNGLKNITVRDKLGNPRINKTGVIINAPNLPKSKDNIVFVRGTSSDSNHKPEVVNGLQMYHQQIWIKGSVIVEMLNEKDLI